jgi:hypothetical protein
MQPDLVLSYENDPRSCKAAKPRHARLDMRLYGSTADTRNQLEVYKVLFPDAHFLGDDATSPLELPPLDEITDWGLYSGHEPGIILNTWHLPSANGSALPWPHELRQLAENGRVRFIYLNFKSKEELDKYVKYEPNGTAENLEYCMRYCSNVIIHVPPNILHPYPNQSCDVRDVKNYRRKMLEDISVITYVHFNNACNV